ncbi:CHAT domain-containing protein [Propionivibrio dicarboxylicus]|uniref:CHAT domain-containing protein n=1 Tax=Propionivibrio dicarboxylicus TaxID=83767 RepID=A0A1G8F0U7_9RHOO|nr:CHAT domain-containing protein [Propionivibrio dicarboxylicus]SDH75750.1 CHAT domain-containing protein [Propionivibrio dicarboxylicus]
MPKIRVMNRLLAALLSMLMASIAYAETLNIQTDAGPLAIERGDIPLMYEDKYMQGSEGMVSPDYLRFLQERLFPNGIPQNPVEPSAQPFLFRYCVALYETKQYGQALQCLDAVGASVSMYGDPVGKPARLFPIQIIPLGIEVNSPGGEYPLSVREPMQRSEILLELGDQAGAIKQAMIAWEQRGKIPDSSLPAPYKNTPQSILARTTCRDDREGSFTSYAGNAVCGRGGETNLTALTHAAIVFSLGGDKEKSALAISEIKSQLTTFEASIDKKFRTQRRMALVKAYMAQGDYRAALEMADDESTLGSDLFLFVFGAFSLAHGSGSGISLIATPFMDQYSISSKFQVAHARVEVGRLAEAKSYLDEILAREEIAALPGIYWAALYDRGRIAESEQSPEEAISLYQRAVAEIEKQRSTISTENAKIGFFGDKQSVYQALIRLLFQSGRIEDAFLMVERSKSRALVDMLASKQDFHIVGPDAEKVRQLLGSSQANEVSLTRDASADRDLLVHASHSLEGKQEVTPAQVAAILGDLRNLKTESRAALSSQAPELASLVSVPTVSLDDIDRALPPDHAIVSYYYDSQNLYAFVFEAKQIQAVKLERADLESEIQSFRQAIEQFSDDYPAIGKKLYDRLVAPLLPLIRNSKLIIAGHGKLHYLPFAALFDGSEFLIDRYQLTYLPSASTLKYIAARRVTDKSGTVLALGNPDLGDRKYDLPFAEKEAQLVATIFSKSEVLLKEQASKKNLIDYGAGFRYLHFATHGKFDADDPLGSALMLAGNSATDPRDRLTVGELYSMSLDAELVTLSACETGLGKIANGDDVVGLVRGFLYAGANQVVSTLWPIDDEATSSLMAGFYTYLKAGKPSADAMRQAQLDLKRKYPKPIFWAAFQMTARH